jgi:hypothetical protein
MPKVSLRPIDSFEDRIKQNLVLCKGGKTNEDLAKSMGVKRSTVGNRLRKPLEMRLDEVFRLCEKQHIDIADFVGKVLKLG